MLLNHFVTICISFLLTVQSIYSITQCSHNASCPDQYQCCKRSLNDFNGYRCCSEELYCCHNGLKCCSIIRNDSSQNNQSQTQKNIDVITGIGE